MVYDASGMYFVLIYIFRCNLNIKCCNNLKKNLITSEIPFDPCPSTPNCCIDQYLVRNEIQSVMVDVESTLHRLHPARLTRVENGFDCEFKVFFFTDDVLVRLIDSTNGVMVWIRSSSRVGDSDLGVNKRRVKRFLKYLKSSQSKK